MRFGMSLVCCLLFQIAFGQSMDLKDLTGLLELSPAKLENHLQKKGFKRNLFEDRGELGVCFTRKERGKSAKDVRAVRIVPGGEGYELAYQTTCKQEDSLLKTELYNLGFHAALEPKDEKKVLYQKESIRIETSTEQIDTAVFYVIKAGKKQLPKRKDLLGAEDLLQLDAHEYLLEVFGKENVKTDVFYFTETETNKCSVIFPNSNREAIFIWNDEANMKDLSFIVIGGNLKSKESTGDVNQIAHNAWMSRQGVYCGMSLKEVEELNHGPVQFYNWQTESAGYLAPNNKGALDFSKLGIVFNCLNCGFVKMAGSQITESGYALDQNQKVYVTTLIILPDKKNVEARVRR